MIRTTGWSSWRCQIAWERGTIILHNNWSLDIIWNNALPCPTPGYCLLLPPPGFNPRHSLLYFFGSLQDLDKFVVAYFREWAAWGVEREGWWLLRMLYWNWYPNIIITSLCFVINYVLSWGGTGSRILNQCSYDNKCWYLTLGMSVLSGARADGWITCTICIHHILELLFSLTRLCFDHDGMDVDGKF